MSVVFLFLTCKHNDKTKFHRSYGEKKIIGGHIERMCEREKKTQKSFLVDCFHLFVGAILWVIISENVESLEIMK